MKVGKDYKIESDSLNITLFKRQVSRKGGEYWLAIGCFSRFGSALKALADLKVRETNLRDLATVVKKQDELYSLIESLKVSSKGVKEEG